MSKEKLDIFQRHQILFDLLSKFGERGFELFEKSCAIIEGNSEPAISYWTRSLDREPPPWQRISSAGTLSARKKILTTGWHP